MAERKGKRADPIRSHSSACLTAKGTTLPIFWKSITTSPYHDSFFYRRIQQCFICIYISF